MLKMKYYTLFTLGGNIVYQILGYTNRWKQQIQTCHSQIQLTGGEEFALVGSGNSIQEKDPI